MYLFLATLIFTTRYSMYNPCALCQSAIPVSPLYRSQIFFLPSGQRTQSGLLDAITHTISSGTGNSVSIAEANGWISSGHEESKSHSIVLQFEQKERLELHFCSFLVPRSLTAVYFLVRGHQSALLRSCVRSGALICAKGWHGRARYGGKSTL